MSHEKHNKSNSLDSSNNLHNTSTSSGAVPSDTNPLQHYKNYGIRDLNTGLYYIPAGAEEGYQNNEKAILNYWNKIDKHEK